MPTHEHAQHNFDLVVLGSGAGGLTAAATAARRGLKVLVVEKAEHFGGTSAISGGAVWLYGTDQARAAGAVDSPEAIRTYLRQVIGDGYDPALVDAFIEHGHQALRWLEQNTELRYALRPHSPDYYPDAPVPPSLAGRWRWSSTTAGSSARTSRTCRCRRPACCCSAA